jgi:GAF domain-containing protein
MQMSMPAAATILDIVASTTGLGFCAVTRIAGDRFVMLAVRDTIDFGLCAGESIGIDTTICREISQHRQMVVIEDVETDATYINHYAPKFYGFKSYISAPVILEDGSFFGTLCGLDATPRALDTPAMRATVAGLAALVGYQLDAMGRVSRMAEALARVIPRT